MAQYIAFLRAVNVGGRVARMADVRACLSAGGFGDVESYIQSGNIRVSSHVDSEQEVADAIEVALAERFGFEVPALVRTPRELAALITAADAIPSPLPGDARRYVAFLRRPPPPAAVATLEGWDRPHERALVSGREVLIWLTIGAHEAKLTNARVEREIAGLATTRDIKVVRALAERWGEGQSVG